MKITPRRFEAYLKCPMKCWLRSAGEHDVDNPYAVWFDAQNEAYRAAGIERLISETSQGQCALSPSEPTLKSATWKLAVNVFAQRPTLEAHLHAVRRVPMEDQQNCFQLVPVRFVFTNKLNKDDKSLLGFDALLLSELLNKEVSFGTIVHGTHHAVLKTDTSLLVEEVCKRIAEIESLLSNPAPPALVLNRHCPECEFQARCRQEATAKDDLSLLQGMSEKERERHRSKGIFTVTQLSYTFRPKRTPKRAKNLDKPRYLALQALAIRENTVYIHGAPVLPESETQVYLDIEGLLDREAYYLIGMLVVSNGHETFHSFWADTRSDEPIIFAQFAETISGIDNCRVFHFGDYETTALKSIKPRLAERHQQQIEIILQKCTNVLSIIYPHVYFPTYSNSLKEIGRFLGIAYADAPITGLESVIWRSNWELNGNPDLEARLRDYNKADCLYLKGVTEFILRQISSAPGQDHGTKVGRTTEMSRPHPRWKMFDRHDYALEDLKCVIKSAYFDYQREKVFVRTDPSLKKVHKQHRKLKQTNLRANQERNLQCKKCPFCRTRAVEAVQERDRFTIDLKFSKNGVRKAITHTTYFRYRCLKCGQAFSSWDGPPHPPKYGHGLRSWCVYWHLIGGANMRRITRTLGDLFGLFILDCETNRFKGYFRSFYQDLYVEIRQSLLQGTIIHVDETPVNLRGQCGYVWVMTSLEKVYYFYRPSREGSFLAEMLSSFRGVLISDFFTAYDSLPCGQQ